MSLPMRAEVLKGHLDGLLLRSERVTLSGWLAALPAELVRSRPRLLLGQTLFALVSGQLDDVEGPLAAAERAAAQVSDEPYEPSVGRAASLVANVPAAIALELARHVLLVHARQPSLSHRRSWSDKRERRD